MTTIRTVADLKAFLEQFSDDTLVEFPQHGRYFDSVETDFVSHEESPHGFCGDHFDYLPARAAWTYMGGEAPRHFPAIESRIRFGSVE